MRSTALIGGLLLVVVAAEAAGDHALLPTATRARTSDARDVGAPAIDQGWREC